MSIKQQLDGLYHVFDGVFSKAAFPSLREAIAYCSSNGLKYVIDIG